MRVLIADIVGYLGRPLAAALAARGHEVVCLLPSVAESETGAANPRFLPWPSGPLPDNFARGAGCAYYLRPSLEELPEDEADRARQFALSLRGAGAQRLIYLGSV